MKNKIILALCTIVLLLFNLTGALFCQELSVILSTLEQLEKRLNKIEAKQKLNYSKLQNQINQRAENNSQSESDSSLVNLLPQIETLKLAVNKLENKDNKLNNTSQEGLVDDLRLLTSQLRTVIQNAPNNKSGANISELFKPEVKGFFYYHHDASTDDGQTNSFDFSRVYIGAKYTLSDKFTARYLTDVGHASGSGKFEVFTKYAYLDWKMNFWKAHVIIGLQGTQNWKPAEKAWGYRIIRKSPMESFGSYLGNAKKIYTNHLQNRINALLDTTNGHIPTSAEQILAGDLSIQKSNFGTAVGSKMGASADIGVNFSLKPTSKFYLNFMILNGSGYKKAENNMFKNIQIRTGSYFFNYALHLSTYFEIEPWRGKHKNGFVKNYKNFQWDLFAGYNFKNIFIIGANANSKIFSGSYENIITNCFSVFGNVDIMPAKLKALARFDFYRTGFNKSNMAKLKTNANLVIIGLDYRPHKLVNIIPNFQILLYEDGQSEPDKAFYVHLQFKL